MPRCPVASKSRPKRSSGPGLLYIIRLRLCGSACTRSRDSCANGWSSRLRAPYSHQTCRVDASAASAWSIARTGVAPTPALSRTMGRSPGRSVKLPRGALTSNTSPTRTWLVHVGTGHAVQLLLNTHAVVICAWRVRERVTAQQRRRIRVRPQAQDDELARLGSDQRTSVRGHE